MTSVAGGAFSQPMLDEQRRRTEEDYFERAFGARVFVPQALHRLGPVRELLDLVEDEHRSPPAGLLRREPGGLPLLLDPRRLA